MKYFLLVLYCCLCVIVHQTTNARIVGFEDSDIQYFGRWQKTLTDIQSVSSGAYLKTTIVLGEQQRQIKLKLSQSAIIYTQIDKQGPISKMEAIDNGVYPIELVINLPTATTTRTMITIMSDISSTICLQAIEINDDTSSSMEVQQDHKHQQPHLIEFVGHDLTLGLGTSNSIMTSFPWLVSSFLATERSQIAFPGAWLMDHQESIGMETQYFKGTSFYSPSIVVVLLGEYDQYPYAYTTRLSNFLSRIRNHFPHTVILVLSEPLGVLFQESQAAVTFLNDVETDQNIHFIDTTGWIQYGHTAYIDPLHLNDIGQDKFARKLAPLLKAKLNRQPFPGPQPNPNLPFHWQTMDVGQEKSVGLIGSVSFDSAKTFTLWGSGKGFSVQDGFRFVYQALSGNGSIQVTIESHSAFASCAKAGIMMREHLAHGSPHVMLGLSPQDGLFIHQRQVNLNSTRLLKKKRVSPPYRLRLTRQGNTKFVAQIGSTATDTWETFSEIENPTPMARDIYVGLAVTSCDPTVVSVAKFADVTLSGGVGGGGFYYHQQRQQNGLVIQH
ncbi:hypothetical protein MFLAVUS_000509 [Mucor flavus]|uniref:SGNH hydrolase-type esterase domain-containing protein n=1 Tax=Mucor flavus TaxID=439312 RepID=A0ABP9YJY7_9FUNG